jgi:hypothetical protein
MTNQDYPSFWRECRGQAAESVMEAFHSLPPRYFLAAALLLPLAILASACRLAAGWAADRFTPQKA